MDGSPRFVIRPRPQPRTCCGTRSRNLPAQVEPGPGQELVWEYPRPTRLEAVDRLFRVVLGGTTIADTASVPPPAVGTRSRGRRSQDQCLSLMGKRQARL